MAVLIATRRIIASNLSISFRELRINNNGRLVLRDSRCCSSNATRNNARSNGRPTALWLLSSVTFTANGRCKRSMRRCSATNVSRGLRKARRNMARRGMSTYHARGRRRRMNNQTRRTINHCHRSKGCNSGNHGRMRCCYFGDCFRIIWLRIAVGRLLYYLFFKDDKFLFFFCVTTQAIRHRSRFHTIGRYVLGVLIRHSNVIETNVRARLTRRTQARIMFMLGRCLLFLTIFHFGRLTNRLSDIIKADRLTRATDCAPVFVFVVVKRNRHTARAIKRFRSQTIFQVLFNDLSSTRCNRNYFRAYRREDSTICRSTSVEILFFRCFYLCWGCPRKGLTPTLHQLRVRFGCCGWCRRGRIRRESKCRMLPLRVRGLIGARTKRNPLCPRRRRSCRRNLSRRPCGSQGMVRRYIRTIRTCSI